MTEAKWPSADGHSYAIAISCWDNEGGAVEDDPPHLVASFTSARGEPANFIVRTLGSEHEAGTPGAPKDYP
jgi:hypothetical protein